MDETGKENKHIRLRWLLIGLILVCIFPISFMLKKYYLLGGSEWYYWISSFSFSITLIVFGIYLGAFVAYSPFGNDSASEKEWWHVRNNVATFIGGAIFILAGIVLLFSQVNLFCDGCIYPSMFRFNDYYIEFRPDRIPNFFP
jgi:hypothetical protein